MLNEEQLAEVKKRMLAEHARIREEQARDLEALDRIMKYLPGETTQPLSNGTLAVTQPTTARRTPIARRGSLAAELVSIIDGEPERVWTRRELKVAVDAMGFIIRAKDHAAAMNQSLRTLVERGEIEQVQPGAGSAPAEYQSKQRSAGVPESEDGPDVESGGH